MYQAADYNKLTKGEACYVHYARAQCSSYRTEERSDCFSNVFFRYFSLRFDAVERVKLVRLAKIRHNCRLISVGREIFYLKNDLHATRDLIVFVRDSCSVLRSVLRESSDF